MTARAGKPRSRIFGAALLAAAGLCLPSAYFLSKTDAAPGSGPASPAVPAALAVHAVKLQTISVLAAAPPPPPVLQAPAPAPVPALPPARPAPVPAAAGPDEALHRAALQIGISEKLLRRVALYESGMGQKLKGRGAQGDLVSRGLMQIQKDAFFDILARHKTELAGLLSADAGRYAPVIGWLGGHRGGGVRKAVTALMFDMQLSAYVGALRLRELGGARDPGRTYLYYVSPKMAEIVYANANSRRTAMQLALEYHVKAGVVANNPPVYGPGGGWTPAQIIANSADKFSGVAQPSAPRPRHAARFARLSAG